MEKEKAINILEYVQDLLQNENSKDEGLKKIEEYKKNIQISTNPKIIKLVERQKEYIEKDGKERKKDFKNK